MLFVGFQCGNVHGNTVTWKLHQKKPPGDKTSCVCDMFVLVFCMNRRRSHANTTSLNPSVVEQSRVTHSSCLQSDHFSQWTKQYLDGHQPLLSVLVVTDPDRDQGPRLLLCRSTERDLRVIFIVLIESEMCWFIHNLTRQQGHFLGLEISCAALNTSHQQGGVEKIKIQSYGKK